MRESFRAYRISIAIGFRAAPLQATFQLFLGVLIAVAPPIVAYGAKLLIDAAVSGDLGLGVVAVGLLAGVSGATLVALFYYVDCVFSVIERAGLYTSRQLMELIGGAEGIAHHERPDYLDQVLRIREQRGRLTQMVNATVGIVRASATLTITGILLAQLHPVLLFLPLTGVVSFWLGKRSTDLAVAAQEATSESERLRRHLFELGTSAGPSKELRMFGLIELLLTRHHNTSDRVLVERDRASWRGAALHGVEGFISAVAYIGAIGLVLAMALTGRATAGDVVLVIGLAATMGGVIGVAVSYGTQFLMVLRVARRFVWLEDYAGSARREPTEPAPCPERLEVGIELQDVAFRYPNAAEAVLDGVTIMLPAGQVVAVVGENGAGKTTMIKLLCGFYQPTGGRIGIDGVNMMRISPVEWRARVGGAFQDHVPFEFLVRENVGIADLPRIGDREAVTAAVERAGAEGLVGQLPTGLEAQLGARWDKGTDLSGGQWQQLALSRGVMRENPLLVVFDEPTATLDPQTEHALFERFAQRARNTSGTGAVTVLVSHRFSTVRMADLIVVLDAGRVLQAGSHEELMAAGGLYAELYELQSRQYR